MISRRQAEWAYRKPKRKVYRKMTIDEMISGAASVGIAGHVHPDGDCIGSCLALKNYIAAVRPDIEVKVWLEEFSSSFAFLRGAGSIEHDMSIEQVCDLFFVVDCGDIERLGPAAKYFRAAGRTVCVDHHMTNEGFADVDIIQPKASSTCEMLYYLMDTDKIDHGIAECLYVGIAFDTGVFRHTNCSLRTMQAVGSLIEKGLDTEELLDRTFFRKTYEQNRVLGHVLEGARLTDGGRLIFGVLTGEAREACGVSVKDLDGIVDQLRVTEGVEAAAFIYETMTPGEFKVSMRANQSLNVASVALQFGGGGHIKAAGCTLYGDPEAIIDRLREAFSDQLV
jgi:phosphoesterase RecJ-like protein